MKPHLEQIQPTDKNSFSCRLFNLHHFDTKLHFHPEYELTLIEKSCGKRFVGQHIGSFNPGDLVLIGKQVPHCWLNEIGREVSHHATSIVIQFRENFLGDSWLATTEFSGIHKMLQLSERGICFSQETSQILAADIGNLLQLPAFEKLISLLQILQALALQKNFLLLNGHQNLKLSQEDCNRIQIVFEFIQLNFSEDIRLQAVAEMMYMAPTSFCRYFKKITRKTFTRFLIDYRMEHARTQLIQTDKSITGICYESGFRSLAHFNQQFKMLNTFTPGEYRKQFNNMRFYL